MIMKKPEAVGVDLARVDPLTRLNVYVASSWPNATQPAVVGAIRAGGVECYDSRHPAEGDNAFAWSDIDPAWLDWTAEQKAGLAHPAAVEGFNKDFEAMERANSFVLVLPCGSPAHLELGWAVGALKRTAILLTEDHEAELMSKMVDYIALDIDDLVAWLAS